MTDNVTNDDEMVEFSQKEEIEIHNWLGRVHQLRTQKPIEGADYYAISLFIDENGKVRKDWQTIWCGFTETKPRREIRKARIVDPAKIKKLFKNISEPAMIVNNSADLTFFASFGGHGIIEAKLVAKFFPEILEPREMFKDSSGLGYISNIAQSKKQHAPSKKLRMKVLKRDGRRCVICGRSPFHYVDVELHVHHVIPWGQGGITEEENLITLCKACHDGLDPHYDRSLRQYQVSEKTTELSYMEKLKIHQLAVHRLYSDEERT